MKVVAHVAQERAVMADDRHPADALTQPSCQEAQRLGVEMIGGFVEEQQIGTGTEGDREAHTVSPAYRQRRQRARTVGARGQGLERDVDAPLGIPRVEAGREVERIGVGVLGSRGAGREIRGRPIELLQSGQRIADRVVDEASHGACTDW